MGGISQSFKLRVTIVQLRLQAFVKTVVDLSQTINCFATT